MPLQKVILYYGFAPLADPDAVRLWQKTLAESLGLKGRVLISPHGINGTLGGPMAALKRYVRATRDYPAFRAIDFKWSEGEAAPDGSSALFPRLSVKVRAELVAFGAPDEIKVSAAGIEDGGTRLSPAEVHDLVARRPDAVFFDGRNYLESEIGRFRDAVRPEVTTTHDFLAELDSGKYDHLKDKPVITYCTGGIRCEILTPLMRQRGFTDVYQIDGGIVRYGETFGDDGLWEGSLYVFDGRGAVDFSDQSKVIGRCDQCDGLTNLTQDCDVPECKQQYVRCASCAVHTPTCAAHTTASVATGRG